MPRLTPLRARASRAHRSLRPLVLLAALAALATLSGSQPSATARTRPGKADSPIADQLLQDRPGLAIPEPLKPWVGWVLHDKEANLCPPNHSSDEDGVCTWPARLGLNLRDKGGTFTQSFRVYRRDWVPLPGSGKLWPQDVRVDGKPAVVAPTSGEQNTGGGADDDASEGPRVLLEPGEHTITGTFVWDELPESLPVPPTTGLVTLTVGGKPVPSPSREEDGLLYLHKEADEEEEDVLELTVHRKVSDDIPLVLATRISLRIAGKSREVTLGKALPADFVPLSLHGGLPARLEPDGRMKVQVRPGSFELTLEARHDGPINELRRPAPEGQWPADEIWVFEAKPELRVVTFEGAPALDPQQTTLPSEWKGLPAFPIRLEDALKLKEERRGDQNPAPDRLTLHRRLWLDFNGQAYTAHDRINGTVTRTWRLEVAPPTELGRVGALNKDQVITRGASGRPGVELRQGRVVITADSRIPRSGSELTAVSWDADFSEVSLDVQLPPGWRLFYASGADDVPDTLVHRYTLLDLFLILLVAMAVGRLFGIGWGATALVALGLSCTEPGAPRWIFLAVLVTEAVSRVLPKEGVLTTIGRYGRLGARLALVLVLIAFASTQVRRGLHPALEHGGNGISQSDDLPDWLKKHDEEQSGAQRKAPSGSVDSEGDGFLLLGSGEGGGGTGEGTIGLGNLGTIGRGGSEGKMGKKSKPKSKLATEESKEDGLFDRDSGLGREDSEKMGSLRPQKEPERQRSSYTFKSPPSQMQQLLRNNAFEIDPNATAQTGPGLPRWNWEKAHLTFNGPVKRDQVVHLYLVPPWLTRLLLLGQVALLILVTLRLCGITMATLRPRAVAALLLFFSLGLTSSVRAEYPSDELLEKLQERIIEEPSCRPNCASSSRLQLDATARSLRLRMDVGAAAATAVPLPGSPGQWLPTQVLVDGKPATALRLQEDRLWLAVSPGSHQVVLEGPLPRRATVQLALPLKPHRVEAKVKGWQLDGVHEDGLADDDLQLSRVAKGKGGKGDADEEEGAEEEGEEAGAGEAAGGLQPSALPPFAIVEREIQIGQKWQVATRVVRKTPTGSAVVLEVPLLAGESVTTPEVRVQNGKALVNMGPTVSELSWRSLLQEKPRLELVAPKGVAWSETWRLTVSPVYHIELSGIPVIHQQDSAGLRQPEWRPWPGEKVGIEISRPDGVPGRTLTIDYSELKLKPGLRATDACLTAQLRTSRGGPHSFGLPPGTQLLSVEINGKSQPLQNQGDRLMLSLLPGAQRVVVHFQLPEGITTTYRTPQIDLGAPSVNAHVVVQPGSDRWLLFCAGPPLGPSVLFWSLLVVVAITALVLGRFGKTPLRAHQYFLLGVGLTQVPVYAAAIVIGWLLVLGHRERPPYRFHWFLFNVRQFLILAWTIAAMVVLGDAIRHGLLGTPDMQVAGNLSSPDDLRWFADHTDGKLPAATAVSLPLRAYQAAMLAWALWIAQALLGWLRWGYAAFITDGVLRPWPDWEKKWKGDNEPPPTAPGGPASPPPDGGSPPPTPPVEESTGQMAAPLLLAQPAVPSGPASGAELMGIAAEKGTAQTDPRASGSETSAIDPLAGVLAAASASGRARPIAPRSAPPPPPAAKSGEAELPSAATPVLEP